MRTKLLRGKRKRRPDWAALWGDLHYPGRRRALRAFLCELGLHYPIRWSETAHPGCWDPPHPPEPDWQCDWCGKIREPYKHWWLAHTWWPIQQWWYERPGGRFEREIREMEGR